MDASTVIPCTEDGLYTTAQARAAGLGRRVLQGLVRRHEIDHVCRGVYGPHLPDLTAKERHLRLVRAGLKVYPDALASHVSAVVAHGLPVFDHPLHRACLDLFQEKRREDRLRRLGYTVIRVTWADLLRPERVVAWIRQATSAA